MNIEEIVDWLVKEGTENTDNGSWIIYFNEVIEKFDITLDWLRDNLGKIITILDAREEILSETWVDADSFDMNFCYKACKNWDGTQDWGCHG